MTPPQGFPFSGTTGADVDSRVVDALVEAIRSGTHPDVMRAQAILLRRLALEGDVVPSRLPAPRNVTEMGGYLNLLTTLEQPGLRQQALSAILGVAGVSPAAGWDDALPPLPLTPVANDRPAGQAGAGAPLAVTVRSDFAAPLQAVLDEVHRHGALLPLLSPSITLVPHHVPSNLLGLLGRELAVAPGAVLTDPIADPVVLARPADAPDAPARLHVHAWPLPGRVPVPPRDWVAVAWDSTAGAIVDVPLTGLPLLPVEGLLARAGFQLPDPLPRPTHLHDHRWNVLRNVTGLVAGGTTLGDELVLSYDAATIAASGLNARRDHRWDGTDFAPAGAGAHH